MSKSLLLVVYAFPPYPAIGGRRWAKFAKYLALKGYEVHVVGATPPSKDKVSTNWTNDIKSKNIKTYYIDNSYPHRLLNNGSSLFNRLIRKVAGLILQICGKGIVQDEALFWKNNLLSISRKLIKEYKITNVISTGPPHRSNYYVTLLKNEFPSLNIICDFRDSWLDGKVYGLTNISKRVLRVEEQMEKYTAENANFLLFTYKPMLEDFKKRYEYIDQKKFQLFTHNYDPDDYNFGFVSKSKEDKYRFIYGGTITTTAVVDAFIPLLKALKQIKNRDSALYSKIEVSLYGQHNMLSNAVKDLGIEDSVKLKEKVSEEKFYNEVSNANFLLSFLGDNWKDNLTTKNIALLPFHKPIILVSKEGLVSEFIRSNSYGVIISPDNCLQDLLSLFEFYRTSIPATIEADIEQHSYPKATDRLIQLFQ
ncbi:hypothetical protein I2I11_11080 [Pontibacter sp. 172403-2]|uniref:hypothetical protein n=1 Tax=Pontibacter rufus TaxID=2791028 RepID=UPI0018AF6EEF|nr:hypothetical protein [Pontibacter sp. 172403-2]MBF9253836.1 hypothetical protein [Pontibacter sp. 172403-2]